MIFTDRTIIVRKGTSSINDTIVLDRGDKNVEVRFTLNEGSPFKFGSGASPNIIKKTEAAYGQLIIETPNDLPAIFSEVAPTNNGKIVFTITAEMIDEITEVGNYTFQIRLLDESRNSRATLPEVVNGIEIREPIAIENVTDTNEVGEATVGYALTTAGTTEDAFDTQGNYNKTTWATGDRITAAKLNKIEQGIVGVIKKIPHYNETLMFEISGDDYSSFMNNNYFNMSALNIDETKSYIVKNKFDINDDEEYTFEFIYNKENDVLINEDNQLHIYNHKSYNGTNLIEDVNSAVLTNNNITPMTTMPDDGYFRLYEIDKVELDNKCLPNDVNIKNSLTVGTRIGDIGEFSVTEGDELIASGNCSHAEGNYTEAIGNVSHAEGGNTTSSGDFSHAEGFLTEAIGNCSHAEGKGTIASSENQHVQGKFNIKDTTGTYAHIVGNGVSNGARSNAHTLDWQGNGWYQGKVSIDGTPTEDKDLTTKKYVDDAIANQPQISFDTEGNLVVTIGGVTKKFKEITE